MPRRWMRRLAFVPVILLAGLLALEGGSRLVLRAGSLWFLPTPEMQAFVASNTVEFDPDLGWRPSGGIPLVKGQHWHGGTVEALAAGKPVGEAWGFAFGDSQTHGAGLAEHQPWPDVTGRALNAAGIPVRVINLGSSGYRSSQVLQLIERVALPADPAFLVVDSMTHDSDLLPRDYHPPYATARAVLFESRLYRLLWLGLALAQGQNFGAMGELTVLQDESPTQPQRQPGNHAVIAALARERGIPLLFVDYPYIAGPARSLAPDNQLPPGVPVVHATAALCASGLSSDALFLDGNHLTVEGSEIVGRAVAEEVARVVYGRELAPAP